MQIKIGGHQYQLEFKKFPEDDAMAECSYDNATIYISSSIKVQSIKESALLHEILHACNSTFGQDGIEHGLLDSFAEQLYQVLKDNFMLNQYTLNNLLKTP